MQQAIVVKSPKAPFIVESLPIPTPAKGEILVKIHSVALNPINWKQRAFNVLVDEYPVVLGSDVAGVVEQVSEDAQGFAKGDRVFACVLHGGFQQYIAFPAAIALPIPDNITYDQVSTFPIAFHTACVGLFAPAPIGIGLNPTFSWDKPQQGESALVIGSGSVGQFAIQLLKFLGFTRIIAYASSRHEAYLRELGATEVVDRTAVPLEELAVSPPVKVVYDAVGSAFKAACECVVDGGRIVTVSPMPISLPTGKTVAVSQVQGYYYGPDVVGPKRNDVVGYLAVPEHTTFGKVVMRELQELLAKGVVVANPVEVLPNGVAGVIEGLERLQKGSVSGVKLVAHP
ncbi:GroES-like protein [Roridomyces roridus]|uniref:GroES-like protein n=1 Tax=Roridomyces roridus TaxID=1738132 RepID=A0AAD7C5M6_9AGAR|nr:GroES-like protein [Roridomyces roridus]